MGIKRIAVAAALLPAACLAQEPLSAIPWLTEELGLGETVSEPEIPAAITATRIGQPNIDAVGILPARISGFPADLWSRSDSAEIASLIAEQSKDLPQTALRLLYMLLLAEADPPSNSDGLTVFLSRTDKLISFGALEQAGALLDRAGLENRKLFARWFDIGLLTGSASDECLSMLSIPAHAPSKSAMIYCLAKRGETEAAAILYSGAIALGDIDSFETRLLAQYVKSNVPEKSLNPTGFPGTPLNFAMEIDAGLSHPLSDLQDPFLFRNLAANAGWKTRLESLERLVASRAISADRLLASYAESEPAGSGGVWERVRAFQKFEAAAKSQSQENMIATLPRTYSLMKQAGLEVAFSNYAVEQFSGFANHVTARVEIVEVAMLSDDFERFAADSQPADSRQAFLFGIATGRLGGAVPRSDLERAIVLAMQRRPPRGEIGLKLEQGKLGEALLSALLLLEGDSRFDPSNVEQALATLVWTGLEYDARGIALQILLDDRS